MNHMGIRMPVRIVSHLNSDFLTFGRKSIEMHERKMSSTDINKGALFQKSHDGKVTSTTFTNRERERARSVVPQK
jgi:hypothetical protein